jgi:hypothetical protein
MPDRGDGLVAVAAFSDQGAAASKAIARSQVCPHRVGCGSRYPALGTEFELPWGSDDTCLSRDGIKVLDWNEECGCQTCLGFLGEPRCLACFYFGEALPMQSCCLAQLFLSHCRLLSQPLHVLGKAFRGVRGKISAH